ncbi:hypothetical protein FRC01_004663 [Tulasnella sp. 417]|nr:hypothetical protein FRC01_004663 [Tulasnella sp. 417]
MASLPPIPTLPELGEGVTWSARVQEAHSIILLAYEDALRSYNHNDGDALRLQLTISELQPVKVVIASLLKEGLNEGYVTECAQAVIALEQALELSARAAAGEELKKVRHIKLVHSQKRRGPGRPRKIVNKEFLADALSPHRLISIADLSRILGVDRKTVKTAMATHGLERKYSALTDLQLDALIAIFKELHPDSGLRFAMGFIRRYGLRIQRQRVQDSIKRTDSAGQSVRRYRTITRRTYRVSRPNYLWHMDGYHKLIRYGFVIHGIIDGYCRTIMSLRVSTNNRASTVLKFFKAATEERGIKAQIEHHTSGAHAANETHRWLLRYLFLKDLNADAQSFIENWNHHPVSGPGPQNKSPEDMRLIGQALHGIYVDDRFHGVHADLIQKYYGRDEVSSQHPPDHTGAGYTRDEFGEDNNGHMPAEAEEPFSPSNLAEARIAADQKRHLRHDAVPVPKGSCPFESQSELDLFDHVLTQLKQEGAIPAIAARSGFNELEALKVGKRTIQITLPVGIWHPRVVLWCQGLQVMTTILTPNVS